MLFVKNMKAVAETSALLLLGLCFDNWYCDLIKQSKLTYIRIL